MSTIVSSALTFLDTTDQNQLSAYLTSNFAIVQTCTSDKKVFSPDWSANPLVLQLHAIYDGTNMRSEELNGKITWFYKEGNSLNEVQIVNNASYDITEHGTQLSIKDNIISTLGSDSVTFVCKIQLDEDGVDVATVQMTYTLISDTKAVSFYVGTPGGNVFYNQEGELAVVAYAHYGTEVIEAGTDALAGTMNSDKALFKWEKYTVINGTVSWVEIADSDGLSKQLTIKGTDVLNVATFKCTMTYKGVEYVGVATVQDITDTYISEILTVGGNIFKNGVGGSAAYVLVRKNGQDEEVDPLNGIISVSKPSGSGKWYKINHDYDRIDQLSYTPTSQTSTTISQDLIYTWTLMDKNGNAKKFYNGDSSRTGKVIYISCNDIDDTGTLQCVVSKE